MTYEEFYGSRYELMKQTEAMLCSLVVQYENTKREKEGIKPIVYYCSRIKEPDSMIKKLKARGFSATPESALSKAYDGVGVRVICAFAEDVYRFVRWLRQQEFFTIIEEKDYCACPKPNGYRSYHVLIEMKDEAATHAEIQVRTIANDFWATLEYQLKYKKSISNEKVIRQELKRCADEIASLDLSMQTIRNIIREEK